ncbi:MAG TPA: serine/threonine-protein kinase [Gemmatimonadales bacterium]
MKICPVCSTEYADDVKFCANDGQTLRSASPTADLVGQVIADRYHVVKKLGEGGMGQVYLAEHVKMGRRSAIKVMNPSMIHDPDAVARFNREAANASRITHPNVCAVYDFGETPDGVIYLAMEFIEGEPLTDLIQREGALKIHRAFNIFRQVADALQAAHDLGIVHRDLKPDNIMLAKGRDGGDVVKVVDFGIAKAMGGDDAGQKVTKTGLVVGTPEFMSPEQLSGDKLDGRSDLYSLALVFYRMLTGKLPFEASTVQETMIKRLTNEPTKLAAARPDLTFPRGLQEAMDTALARSPVDRYQNVAKFAADVAAVVGGAPGARPSGAAARTQMLDAKTSVAAPPATRASPGKPGGRSKLVPALSVVGVLVVGGGAYIAFAGGKKTPPLNVPADTSNHALQGNTSPSHPGNADTVHKTVASVPTGTRTNPNSTQTQNPPPRQSGLTTAQATALLDLLPDSVDTWPPQTVIDTATAAFNTSGLKPKDRAYAACVVATGYRKLGDRPNALTWARKGLSIATMGSCTDVIQSMGGS